MARANHLRGPVLSTARSEFPLVSVVLPTHNRSRWLRDAISSVLGQTSRSLELLVVDDASDDDTREVVASFQDPRLRYLRNETNRKLSASRNRGIREARGEWIAFLDDDDVWLPEKLEKQLALLGRAGPKTGLIYTGLQIVHRESGAVRGTLYPSRRGDLSEALRESNYVLAPSTVLVRRDLLAAAGCFDESLRYGEDYDLWIRLAPHAPFDFVAEPLVRYGFHPNGMTRSWTSWAAAIEPLLWKHRGYLGGRMRSEYLVAIGISRCMSGHMAGGRIAFLQAIRSHPFSRRPLVHLLLSLAGRRLYAHARARREVRALNLGISG